ncbi:flagellin [Bacillus sp. AK128]
MIINNNVPALNTYRQLGFNNKQNAASMEKLSSGLRINRAGDDAAGLAISEKMRAQIKGLNQATRNAQDGISLIQTAEGALNETHSILQRMRELADQSANDTNTAADRNEIQKEINQLTSEINRIGNTTEFNTKKVLNGNVGENVSAVRGTYDLTFSGTASAAGINIGTQALANGEDFEVLGTDGTSIASFQFVSGTSSNPTAATGATFHDADSLVEALKNNTAVAEKYDVQISSDGNIRFVQKFGQENASGLAVNVNSNQVDTTSATGMTVATAGVSGTAVQSLKMQIGANQNQSMSIDINDMRAQSLGISTTGSGVGFTGSNTVTTGTNNTTVEKALDVTTHEKASAAITAINNAIETVSAERSKLGAFQNRLDHTINNLGTSAENLQAAESRIRDVDMAAEMMKFTKTNILAQASQSMLAQANQKPQSVLQLLG